MKGIRGRAYSPGKAMIFFLEKLHFIGGADLSSSIAYSEIVSCQFFLTKPTHNERPLIFGSSEGNNQM